MATIKEDYVSFEIALLLKKKGFEQIGCQKQYNTQGDLCVGYCYGPVAPTLQMTMKWLREVHNLCLFVIPATIDETFRTGYALYPQCDSRWEWCASKNDRSEATFGFNINKKYCDSHEEACEAAIKYCLEHLI